MKRVLILLLMLIMICPSAMKAEGNTITIINCDKVNIRNEAGQSLGRVGCYTPVTVGETKGDSTYVTVSKAYLELYQEQYGLFEYINFYSGDISGWVKTRCLTEVDEDIDRIIYKAEEYRWEFWTDGIYHEIKSDDVVKNTCYEPHYSTLINFTPLTAHTRVRDLMKKNQHIYLPQMENGVKRIIISLWRNNFVHSVIILLKMLMLTMFIIFMT